MKTATVVGSAASILVAVSVLAVPAVASGAEALRHESTPAQVIYAPTETADAAPIAVRSDDDLTTLMTIWGAAGIALFSGGAIAVGTSVRRQRRLAPQPAI